MLVWVQYKYMYIILQKEVREENVWLGFRPSGTHYRFYQSLMGAQSITQTERRKAPLQMILHLRCVYHFINLDLNRIGETPFYVLLCGDHIIGKMANYPQDALS